MNEEKYVRAATQPRFWEKDKEVKEAETQILALAQGGGAQRHEEENDDAVRGSEGQTGESPVTEDAGKEREVFEAGRAEEAQRAESPVPGIRPGVIASIRSFFTRATDFAVERKDRSAKGAAGEQKQEKARQRFNAAVVFAGCAVFAGTFVWLTKNEAVKRPHHEERVFKSDLRLDPDGLDKQSYQRQYDEKLELVTGRISSIETAMGELNARIKNLTQKPKDAATNDPVLPGAPDLSAADVLAEAGTVPKKTQPRLAVVRLSKPESQDAKAKTPVLRPARRNFDTPIAANRARHEEENTYLPAGSFAKAVVLSGVTAATGGTSASNPVPMLLEIRDLAQLPNAFKANVKACFVTANATGDLSSERVWIRLERLSCLTKKGKAFDVRVQGYVAGEDGKTGVRARIVTRSGQAIANALLTGSIAGLGKAVAVGAQSTTTYSSGATGTVVNNAMRAGIGEGMQNALDRIADYYIRLADKIFPVLELDSGRKVDVVFSQGFSVSPGDLEGSKDTAPRTVDSGNSSEIFGERMRAQRERYAAY